MNLNSAMKFARKEASAVQTRRIASILGAIGDPIGGCDISAGSHDTCIICFKEKEEDCLLSRASSS